MQKCKYHRELIASYTTRQNGVAEQKNQVVVKIARCMLKEKAISKIFRGEAVATVVHLLNHFPTKAVQGKTPNEVWYGRKPNVSYLKIFDCVAYAHDPTEKGSKLDDKSIKCIFVGYSNGTKGFKLYDLITKKLIIDRDVIFDENRT